MEALPVEPMPMEPTPMEPTTACPLQRNHCRAVRPRSVPRAERAFAGRRWPP